MGVFVPRRRTEFLVRQVAGIIQPGNVMVDLCCGSGSVGAVLAATQEQIRLFKA
jgi:release factor glutamine methyltransferase